MEEGRTGRRQPFLDAPAVDEPTGAGAQDPTLQQGGEFLPWEIRKPLVDRLCAEYGVPDSAPVIEAMIDHESGGRTRAIGDSGHAAGLLQLHDAGLGRGMSLEERFDPEANLRRGIDYHARYLAQYGGDVAAAVTAHNAGGGAVNKAYQRGGDWRDVIHHGNVTVAQIYTLPLLKTARERYGWQG